MGMKWHSAMRMGFRQLLLHNLARVLHTIITDMPFLSRDQDLHFLLAAQTKGAMNFFFMFFHPVKY
jgi:hypothetical protein